MILSGFPLTGRALEGNTECHWHDDPYVIHLKASSEQAVVFRRRAECYKLTATGGSRTRNVYEKTHLVCLSWRQNKHTFRPNNPLWANKYSKHIPDGLKRNLSVSRCKCAHKEFKDDIRPQVRKHCLETWTTCFSSAWAKHPEHPDPARVLFLGIAASFEKALMFI